MICRETVSMVSTYYGKMNSSMLKLGKLELLWPLDKHYCSFAFLRAINRSLAAASAS